METGKKDGRGGKREGAGRKPLDPGVKRCTISLRVNPEIKEAFEARGKGWQAEAHKALEEWLARNSG